MAGIAIAERLRKLQAAEGLCASAPGGDILFAEAVIATGARLALIDPFPRDRVTEVAACCDENWPERLAGIFDAAVRSETITCAEDADETVQCEYANHVTLGAAMLRAGRINAKLHALVLWDEADRTSLRWFGAASIAASSSASLAFSALGSTQSIRNNQSHTTRRRFVQVQNHKSRKLFSAVALAHAVARGFALPSMHGR